MKTLDLIPRTMYADGSKETIDLPGGYTASIALIVDSDMRAPWLEHDGHGPVREDLKENKKPGERVLGPTGTRDIWYLYDFAGAVRIARRDGWDAPPYGGKAGEKASRAAEADYKNLTGWCNDEWHWIGVSVSLYAPGDSRTPAQSESLWGIESYGDYWREVAAELLDQCLEQNKAATHAAAVARCFC